MFFLFLILGALLIVNMLIAMMGNTYLMVAETKKEWTRQVHCSLQLIEDQQKFTFVFLCYTSITSRALVGLKPMFYQSVKHRKACFNCFHYIISIL